MLQFKRQYSSNEWTTWKGNFAENTATIPGVSADMYEVRLVDAQGNVLYSESGLLVPDSDIKAPKALKPKAKVHKTLATISSVTVSWTDPRKATEASNTRYVVSYSIKVGKKWTVAEQFSTAENRYTFTGLKPNTSYRVTVIAVNAQGEFGTNKAGNVTSRVNITAKTLKFTAVKVSKPVKFTTEDGASRVEATITPPKPNKIPAGATYESYNLYRVIGSGTSTLIHTPIGTEFFTVTDGILTINWSELGLSDTASNKFVLRAVTDGEESARTNFTIKFSTLKTKV